MHCIIDLLSWRVYWIRRLQMTSWTWPWTYELSPVPRCLCQSAVPAQRLPSSSPCIQPSTHYNYTLNTITRSPALAKIADHTTWQHAIFFWGGEGAADLAKRKLHSKFCSCTRRQQLCYQQIWVQVICWTTRLSECSRPDTVVPVWYDMKELHYRTQ